MKDEWKVGRIIARPYVGKKKGEFKRTSNRHDYALNKEKIDELYNIWAKNLAEILTERRVLGNFSYEVFVLQNLSSIYDYEILRRALKNGIENESTRENAVTKVRKILGGIQNERNIIVMDTYAVLMKMRERLCQYSLID